MECLHKLMSLETLRLRISIPRDLYLESISHCDVTPHDQPCASLLKMMLVLQRRTSWKDRTIKIGHRTFENSPDSLFEIQWLENSLKYTFFFFNKRFKWLTLLMPTYNQMLLLPCTYAFGVQYMLMAPANLHFSLQWFVFTKDGWYLTQGWVCHSSSLSLCQHRNLKAHRVFSLPSGNLA